jgi:hypothetical protein
VTNCGINNDKRMALFLKIGEIRWFKYQYNKVHEKLKKNGVK